MVHNPNSYQTNFLLGQQAFESGDAILAHEYWCACIRVIPNELLSYRQLANAFRSIGYLSEATALINRAAQQFPGNPLILSDQATVLLERGEATKATQLFLKLADVAEECHDIPQALAFLSNALMALEYSDAILPSERKSTAQRWGTLALRQASLMGQSEDIPSHTSKPTTDTVLRVGFISGDLCDHPVGFLLLPLLQHRSSTTWVPYIYDNGSRNDQTHQQLRAATKTGYWRDISQASKSAAIRLILADQLDILIDLSGHSGRNRLSFMAHRLAKRQLSWLGFSGTTGLPTIDHIILDEVLANGCSDQFVESIALLNPSRFCFRPPFAPSLQPPPCTTRDYVTFGAFNNTAKYNPALLTTWAQVLLSMPNSKIILKWRTLVDPEFCNHILEIFTDHGITPDRVELRGFSTHRAMLDEYNDVDIALDTFPFNGGYTSLEALWMGLPLVTLAGQTPIARQSASFLTCLQKNDWVAQTAVQYVGIAQKLAQNREQLSAMRSQLRYQIMDSPLYNAPAFAQKFEQILVDLD